ncbi:hypothetical protein ACNKHM_18380 [Shigella sonnei]
MVHVTSKPLRHRRFWFTSIQSVNFSFVTVMIALGSSMKSDGFHEELIMSSLLGVSFVGAFLVVGSSFILPYFSRVITLPSAALWC